MYGSLHLFEEKPDRCDKIGSKFSGDKIISITPCVWRIKNPYGGFYNTWGYIEVDSSLFPNLTWEDEPVEVDLITKEKVIELEECKQTIKVLNQGCIYDKGPEFCVSSICPETCGRFKSGYPSKLVDEHFNELDLDKALEQ